MNPELSRTADVAPDLASAVRPSGDLAGWAATGFVGFLVLSAAVLCWRRVAGQLSAPLTPAILLFVGLSVATAAATARLAWRSRPRPSRAGSSVPAATFLSAAVLAVGVALSLPGTSPTGLLILWGVLALEESWAWGPAGWRRLVAGRDLSPRPRRKVDVAPPDSSATLPLSARPAFQKPPPDDVTQQLTRSRTAEGTELLSGWVRVEMAGGQRSANVHLAFCPPFARTPRIAVEQTEGPQVRIKTVQLLPYGARFDLKLVALSEEAATVLLEFLAEAVAPTGEPTAS